MENLEVVRFTIVGSFEEVQRGRPPPKDPLNTKERCVPREPRSSRATGGVSLPPRSRWSWRAARYTMLKIDSSRKSMSTDRRARIVELTPEGKRIAGQYFEKHTRDLEELMSVHTETEKQQLYASLKKVRSWPYKNSLMRMMRIKRASITATKHEHALGNTKTCSLGAGKCRERRKSGDTSGTQ